MEPISDFQGLWTPVRGNDAAGERGKSHSPHLRELIKHALKPYPSCLVFNPLTVSVEMIDEALNHFRHSVPISSHRSQVPNPNPSVGPRVIFFLLSSTDSYRLIRPATCRLSQSKFRILLRRLRANAQARFRDLAYFTTLAASPNVI